MKKNTLPRQVADDIYRMITITQELKPGEQLPGEHLLAEKFDVSRTTVREAIKALTSQGVLTVYRGKGTFVSDTMKSFISFGLEELDINHSRLKDLFETRLLFEPELAALACLRASDEEIQEILKAGKVVEEYIRSGKDRSEVDHEFHKQIAFASHNRFMLQLLPIIHHSVSETILLNEQQELLSETTLADHALLMQFLERRDPQAARAAMLIHLHNAMRILGLPPL